MNNEAEREPNCLEYAIVIILVVAALPIAAVKLLIENKKAERKDNARVSTMPLDGE